MNVIIGRWAAIRHHLFLTVFSFIMLYPVIWWIGASVKSNAELTLPSLWPRNPQWSNYSKGWFSLSGVSFTKIFANTFWMEIWIVLGAVITSTLVAYGFARINFRFKRLWFAVLISTMMLPGQVLIIPQYILYNKFHFVNTYVPLILPFWFGGGAFFIFLLIQFIRGIPRELDEAAKIDGCSTYGIYYHIILPLIRPAVVTVAVFTFLWSWQDFYSQLLYLSSPVKYTIELALNMFLEQGWQVEWGQLLAMSLISIIPSIIIFFSAQKYFVEGIVTSGLKG
ncbi:carbohydrate ABC transporter permease [Alicyclobacillus fodiniaquatilis]|jgi:multiple sugar transport system permease protein|uniref:Carbohydrate ABC transporter permease n=1 Tax=Alicyclobacillus fodiniaquatilis TaxID=1661150 RepID=A0ABW4JDS6_9BACL